LVGGDRGIQGALYDSHEIVFITEDMRVVAKSRRCLYDLQGGWMGLNIRLPDLKYIENILHVQFEIHPDPTNVMGPINKKIEGNVVGLSIYQDRTGATLCIDVVAVGPP
jgi:hypothetical protein